MLARDGSSFFISTYLDPGGRIFTCCHGLLYMKRSKLPPVVSVAFQFVMMNAAAYAGFIPVPERFAERSMEKCAGRPEAITAIRLIYWLNETTRA